MLKLTRADGTQPITAIDTTLPKGLLGKLAGIPYCPDAALAAAAGKSGKAEQASRQLPRRLAGRHRRRSAPEPGRNPVYVAGKAYLAGPYKGAPLSLAIVTPAVAGPFDLGTVVVRTALKVDPETAQIHGGLRSAPDDPAGHPARHPLDRAQARPARASPSTRPAATRWRSLGAATSVFGQSAACSSRFQVGDCEALGFKPKLAMRAQGRHQAQRLPGPDGDPERPPRRRQHRRGRGQPAALGVPRPGAHQDRLHPGPVRRRCQCPQASIYGKAKAFTPLLDQPLERPGLPAHLRQPAARPGRRPQRPDQRRPGRPHRLGQAAGSATASNSVPDAPVAKFVLRCRAARRACWSTQPQPLQVGPTRPTSASAARTASPARPAPVLDNSCKKEAQHRSGRGKGAAKRQGPARDAQTPAAPRRPAWPSRRLLSAPRGPGRGGAGDRRHLGRRRSARELRRPARARSTPTASPPEPASNTSPAAAYEANLAAVPPRDGFTGAVARRQRGSALGAGEAGVSFSRHVGGLAASTAYRYRVVATSADGTATGPPRLFTTHRDRPGLLPARQPRLGDGLPGRQERRCDPGAGRALRRRRPAGGGRGRGDHLRLPRLLRRRRRRPRRQPVPLAANAAGWTTENITVATLAGAFGEEPDGVPFQLFSGDLGRALVTRASAAPRALSAPPRPARGRPHLQRLAGTARPAARRRQRGPDPDRALDLRRPHPRRDRGAGGGRGLRSRPAQPLPLVGGGLALVNLPPGAPLGAPGATLAAPSGAVSADGSRIYFSLAGDLYLRQGGETVQVDATVGGGGRFEAASADGSLAFFTKAGHLYRFDAATKAVADLTPGGEVDGVLGASADGAHLYYLTPAGLWLRQGTSTAAVAAAADASNYPPATGTARVAADGTPRLPLLGLADRLRQRRHRRGLPLLPGHRRARPAPPATRPGAARSAPPRSPAPSPTAPAPAPPGPTSRAPSRPTATASSSTAATRSRPATPTTPATSTSGRPRGPAAAAAGGLHLA